MQRVAHQVFTKPFVLAFFDYLYVELISKISHHLFNYHLLEIKEYLKFNE